MAGARRTWDKEYYAAKAKERLERGEDDEEETKAAKRVPSSSSSTDKQEFQAAPKDAAGPMGSDRAFLKERKEKIDLESKVGKTEMINPNTVAGVKGTPISRQECIWYLL
jgi:U4/U6.U5 tri-snRNP component SNU23